MISSPIDIHLSVPKKNLFNKITRDSGIRKEALNPVQGRNDRFESSLKALSRNAITFKLRGKFSLFFPNSIHATNG